MQRPQARRFGRRALAAGLTVVLCGAVIAGAQEEQLPRTDLERVAFVARMPPADGLALATLDVMRSDGTDRSSVAGPDERVDYHTPQWSADGRYIAATRRTWNDRGTVSAVVAIPANGGAPHVLDEAGQSPSWSSDGRRIAWARPDESSLVVVDVISTVPELTVGEPRVIPVGQRSGWPRLSPDGRQLLFNRPGALAHRWELWTVPVDGGEPQRLTATPVRALLEDSTYAWSPTGAHISFISVDAGGYARPRLIKADGTNERLLSRDAPCDQHFLEWAPSGEYLAVEAGCSPYNGLLLVDLEGRRLRTLVPNAFQDWRRLEFAPDGSALYVVTQEGSPGVLSPDRGRTDVYRIPVDGGPFLRLTFDGAAGYELAFYGPHVVLPGTGLPPPPVIAPPAVPDPTLPPQPDDLPPLPGTLEPPGGGDDVAEACPKGEVPQHPFSDVPDDNVHQPNIACMAWWQVVYGISPSRYGPGGRMTRAQMASLLARLIEEGGARLPEQTADYFLDDSGSVHESNINRLAEVGVLRGRGDRLYYPQMQVQRDQMASFVSAAYEYLRGSALPEPRRDRFIDDDRSVHERRINQAAEEGLVAGVDQLHYAPARTERRDQAATRSARVAELMVEQGRATPPQ